MRSHRHSSRRSALKQITWSGLVLLSSIFFISNAYALPKRQKVKRPTPVAAKPVAPPSTLPAAPPLLAMAPQKDISPPPVSVTTVKMSESRALDPILNFRLHAHPLLNTVFSSDTVLAFGGDLDFVLGKRVTVGPSLIYHQTSRWEEASIQEGNGQLFDEELIEVGLQSQIYLTGNTSVGGLLFFSCDQAGESASRTSALPQGPRPCARGRSSR